MSIIKTTRRDVGVALTDARFQVGRGVVVAAGELYRTGGVIAVVPALLALTAAPGDGGEASALETLETTSALLIVIALTDARFQIRRGIIISALKGNQTSGTSEVANAALQSPQSVIAKLQARWQTFARIDLPEHDCGEKKKTFHHPQLNSAQLW